jgi:hypothetical protein
VTVRAEDLPEDLTQPRGKQDWRERPHEIWYERTTGIWQPVWLEPVPAVRIDRVTWEPDLHRSVLRVRVALAGTQGRHEPLRVALRLTLHGEVVADDVYAVTGGVLQRDLPLDGSRIHFDRRRYLWSPKHPNLLDAELTLLGPAEDPAAGREAVLDRVASYCGLRSISTSGGRFVLNGRAYVLRMVLAQNYWPQSHLAAPSPAALRREVELVKELGFNGVRIHQKVEDPRFLAWCDRLGVVAWGELPSTLDFDPVTVRRLTAEWTEVLERDRSSPALVAWVPFNESWGIPNMEDDERQRDAVRALYHLTRAIDPTRPVIGNDGWEHLVSDVFGVHDYSPSGELLRERYGSHEALERTLAQIQPVLPLADPARGRPRRAAAHGHRVRRDHLRPGQPGLLERLRRGGLGRRAARAVRGAGVRPAGQPGGRRVLLHPADRHRAGAQRPARRAAPAQGRPGAHRRGEPAGVRRRAGGRHHGDPARARGAAPLDRAGPGGLSPGRGCPVLAPVRTGRHPCRCPAKGLDAG